MAYAQQAALRAQTTIINIVAGAWYPLEASTANPGVDQSGNVVRSRLERRVAVKVFNAGSAGASRAVLSYNTVHNVKQGSHFLGAGQFVVEPCSTGLTLYGRAKLASGITSIRLIVTEYGY